MITRSSSPSFDSSAVSLGLITPEQATECLALQQQLTELGLPSALDEVLVKKGYLTPEQVLAVTSALESDKIAAIPGYLILEKIGEGGMGTVYKARQTSMDRLVAVKVLLRRFSDSAEGRERFVREARAVAKLSHPNVVAGIDVGEVGDILYFVMEYLDGESVEQTLRRRGRLPWREAAAIVRQVVLALAHAEQHGIVHRDIKPSNIMLLKDGSAKLADLGLARASGVGDVTLTQSGMIVGSPAYLSPEQATGERAVDIRSDIFSLGLTFFELVAGERAHHGSTPMAIISSVLTHDAPVARLAAAGAPKPLIALIATMTQREPERRYQTPRALLEDLDAVLAGRPLRSLRRVGSDGLSTGAASPTARPWTRTPLLRPLLLLGLLTALALAVWTLAPERAPNAERAAPSATVAALDPAWLPPAVSLEQAIRTAQVQAPAAVVYHAELERSSHSIDLADGERTLNIAVAADDGRILEQLYEDEDHSAEVPLYRVTLIDAVATALATAPRGAYAIEAEMLLLPGRAVIEVKLRDGEQVSVLQIDGASGERIGIPPKPAG